MHTCGAVTQAVQSLISSHLTKLEKLAKVNLDARHLSAGVGAAPSPTAVGLLGMPAGPRAPMAGASSGSWQVRGTPNQICKQACSILGTRVGPFSSTGYILCTVAEYAPTSAWQGTPAYRSSVLWLCCCHLSAGEAVVGSQGARRRHRTRSHRCVAPAEGGSQEEGTLMQLGSSYARNLLCLVARSCMVTRP